VFDRGDAQGGLRPARIAGGKMNGFIAEAQKTTHHTQTDVMGYHDAREIPNYWTYAHDFVLQDHMFEPNASWSLPAHLFTVSEWAATCLSADPASCVNDDNQGNFSETLGGSVGGPLAKIIYPNLNQRNAKVEQAVRRRDAHPLPPRKAALPHSTDFAWTDMTYLLYTHHVSWAYYVAPEPRPTAKTTPPCARASRNRVPALRGSGTRCRTSRRSGKTSRRAASRAPPASTRLSAPASCQPSPGLCPTATSQNTPPPSSRTA
jgi:Phosphoesterase family